jgi:hypothetical protein
LEEEREGFEGGAGDAGGGHLFSLGYVVVFGVDVPSSGGYTYLLFRDGTRKGKFVSVCRFAINYRFHRFFISFVSSELE